MIRSLDFVFSLLGLVLCSPVLLGDLPYWFVRYEFTSFSSGNELVGTKKTFVLVKFRTMSVDTTSVASHLASTSSITKLGSFLRRTKLDEFTTALECIKR